MTLIEALKNQGYDTEEIKNIMEDMAEGVNAGIDPEDCLMDYGLEPDYVMDLLEHCIAH